MIKINLLTGDRDRARKRTPGGVSLGQKLTIACSLLLVGSVLVIGWWFWALQRQSAQVDVDLATARQETARLRGVLQQVEQFEARREQLEQRVALIEQLRKGQTGPVHMLDEISKSVPDRLWLMTLEQEALDLTIQGRATSLTAVSDFVANLEGSGYFERPVEILDSKVESSSETELIRFSIKARFAAPEA